MHYYKWNLWRETRSIVHYFEFVKTVKEKLSSIDVPLQLNWMQFKMSVMQIVVILDVGNCHKIINSFTFKCFNCNYTNLLVFDLFRSSFSYFFLKLSYVGFDWFLTHTHIHTKVNTRATEDFFSSKNRLFERVRVVDLVVILCTIFPLGEVSKD